MNTKLTTGGTTRVYLRDPRKGVREDEDVKQVCTGESSFDSPCVHAGPRAGVGVVIRKMRDGGGTSVPSPPHPQPTTNGADPHARA